MPEASKKITFSLELPEILYTGQRSLLFQVWTNLLSNAIKFSHVGGTITVRLENACDALRITVRDEGIGMDTETQKHIFDKFFQADTSRQNVGAGLGLSLCREILKRCGSSIAVTSEPGRGSSFQVTLPANDRKEDTIC